MVSKTRHSSHIGLKKNLANSAEEVINSFYWYQRLDNYNWLVLIFHKFYCKRIGLHYYITTSRCTYVIYMWYFEIYCKDLNIHGQDYGDLKLNYTFVHVLFVDKEKCNNFLNKTKYTYKYNTWIYNTIINKVIYINTIISKVIYI